MNRPISVQVMRMSGSKPISSSFAMTDSFSVSSLYAAVCMLVRPRPGLWYCIRRHNRVFLMFSSWIFDGRIGFVYGDKVFEALLRLRSEPLGHFAPTWPARLVHGFSITCLYHNTLLDLADPSRQKTRQVLWRSLPVVSKPALRLFSDR